ncbi:MAG: signal recognition particle receptor subunit alpha [Candidatus Methanodesulfokora washburnensis]
MVLESLGSKLSSAISRMIGRPTLDEISLNEFIRDVQRSLLEADVNVKIVLELSRRIKSRVMSEKVPPGVSKKEIAVKILYDELVNMLGGRKPSLEIKQGKQNRILLVGTEGSGKTTTAAKLGIWFKKRYGKVAIISSDTIRPASHQQIIGLVGDSVPVFWIDGERPEKIIAEGINKFKDYNIVIIDTAGRHKDERGLMEELKEYIRVANPDYTLLVLDASIGQAAFSQAKAFSEVAPLGGVVVTKLDGSAKGGGALSAVSAAGVPIYFIGVGEKVEDIQPFDADRFISKLLGMGDIAELVEKIEEAIKPPQIKGKFDMYDFMEYLENMRKLGPLDRLIGLIPGARVQAEMDERIIVKWIAIIKSMTEEERRDPSIISGTRIERIARGSGTTQRDVRSLLRAYSMAKSAMSGGNRLMRRLLKGYKI